MNFTVIDFETANSKRASACALGIVRVEEGRIVDKASWLIRPDDMRFDGMNIGIHGIRPEHVVNASEFDVLYKEIFEQKLRNQLVVAHNASFDMSVLRKTLELYGIEFPEFDYLCTVKLAQKTWPDLENHKLNTLSDYLDFNFMHHDALEDCLACANVMMKACEKEGVSTPIALASQLKVKVGKLYPGGYKACSVSRWY